MITKRLLAGVLFVLLGGAAATLSMDYRLGGPSNMGPGFFPLGVGALMALVGGAITVHALIAHKELERVQGFALAPLLLISLAVVAFALLLRPFGLLAALTAMLAIAWAADRERRLIELPLMIVVLATASYCIFVLGLNIPLRLWPL